MSEDLLIENSERQEVSRFKNSFVGYLKKWPWILFCVFISVLGAFVYLKFKSDQYQVKSKVLIKQNNQFSDPNELLFGGGRGGFSRFGKINDETIIFGSYPLVKSALESLKLDVSYRIDDGFKQVEIYKESPIILNFDRESTSKRPTATTFIIELLNDNEFKLTTERPFEGMEINDSFHFGEKINLGSFQFTINRDIEGRIFPSADKYMVHVSSLESLTYSYKNKLKFEEVESHSSILTMSMKTTVPQKSIDFINALIERYIEQNLIDKNEVAENTVTFIDQQLAVISDSLNNKEQNLENFKTSEDISDLSIEGTMIVEKYNQIETDRAQFEVMQQYFDYLKENLKDGGDKKVKNLVAPSAFGIHDLVVNNLVSSLVELNLTKSRLDKEGNTKNPLSGQVDLRIQEVTKTLNESIENLSNANTIILNKLRGRSDKLMASAKRLPSSERQLVNLNRLLKLNENIYLFLMEKRSSAAITKSSNTPDCKVIEPAMLSPLYPIAPNRKMTYLMAILLGMFLPLAVFVFVDFIDDTIKDKEDVKSSTQIPIMGFIPESKRVNSYLTLSENPKSALAESFRIIRTNLSFFQKASSSYIILLTSTVAKEGKTFCAINLASALAASGKKTVLLGFDLRKPQIHNYLGLQNNEGVTNYLLGAKTLKEIIRPTKQENLSVVNAGPIPPNPAELIGTERTKELMSELRDQFDYIILDTPPVGLVADALLLQKEADLSLYVVRQNYSKREYLNQVNDLHTSGKMNNLSLIVNNVSKNSSYGYYEEETKSSNNNFFKSKTGKG